MRRERQVDGGHFEIMWHKKVAKIVVTAYSASWEGPQVPWMGRNQEAAGHRGPYEERGRPWGP